MHIIDHIQNTLLSSKFFPNALQGTTNYPFLSEYQKSSKSKRFHSWFLPNTVFVFHSFEGAKNMSQKENPFCKWRFSESFVLFLFFEVTVLKKQLFFYFVLWWIISALVKEKNHSLNHLIVNWRLHEKREGEGGVEKLVNAHRWRCDQEC